MDRAEDSEANEEGSKMMDYIRVVKENSSYRLALLSYYIDNVGNWITFIACVSITDSYGGSMHTSVYLILRLLPSFVVVTYVGPLADRIDKKIGMIYCSIMSALSVFILAICISSPYMLYILYASTVVQFTMDSLYGPLRNSLIPFLVPKEDLMIASTLDGIGWSAIGAFGASLGGYIVGRYGVRMSFLLDAGSYLLCALLVGLIPAAHCRPRDPDKHQGGEPAPGQEMLSLLVGSAGSEPIADECFPLPGSSAAAGSAGEEDRGKIDMLTAPPGSSAETSSVSPSNIDGDVSLHRRVEAALGRLESGCGSDGGDDGDGVDGDGGDLSEGEEMRPLVAPPAAHPSQLQLQTLADSLSSKRGGAGAGSFLEALSFLSASPFLLFLCAVKGLGSVVWGGADLVAVRFSQRSDMQALGDADLTMGVLFAATGVGCQLGPMLWNYCTPQREQLLIRAIVFAFAHMAFSYLIMAVATDVYVVLLATIIRTIGASVLYIYSTLLVQLSFPGPMQGRVFAIERAFYTVCKISSTLFSGVAFERWGYSEGLVCLMLSALGTAVTIVSAVVYIDRYPTSNSCCAHKKNLCGFRAAVPNQFQV
jgi:MFS family permease